jgi:hypothetical protein
MVNKSTSRRADTEYTMLTQHPHRPCAGQTVLAGHQPVSGILISFSSCQHSNPAMGPPCCLHINVAIYSLHMGHHVSPLTHMPYATPGQRTTYTGDARTADRHVA